MFVHRLDSEKRLGRIVALAGGNGTTSLLTLTEQFSPMIEVLAQSFFYSEVSDL